MSKENKETDAAPETGQQDIKSKSESKPKPKAAAGTNALKAVGAAACKQHGLPRVWVTSDGQAFAQEGDAKAHAKNLSSKETLKVTAE